MRGAALVFQKVLITRRFPSATHLLTSNRLSPPFSDVWHLRGRSALSLRSQGKLGMKHARAGVGRFERW